LPLASLPLWVVGLYEPDASTTDIFFWTFSVGGFQEEGAIGAFLKSIGTDGVFDTVGNLVCGLLKWILRPG
jgi:hypothetical protein